jgi:HlyD family secretion protein
MKHPSSPEDLASIIARAKPRHPIWKWIVIAAIVMAGAGAWYFYSKRNGENAAPVFTTEPLKRGDISLTITATGNLEPTNKVTVGSEISGLIREVYVDSNDRVEKDQELAKIDTTKLSQQTDRARATLLSANARVALAQATFNENEASLKRREELHRLSGGQTPSRADMEATIATVERSRAEVASATAAVSEADAAVRANETDLAKAIIRSPVAGIVLKRSIEPGQTVAAQFTAPELFIIAEKLERMELQVAVAEADIGRVAKGQPATFTVDAWPDRTFTAEVKKVSFGSEILNNVVTYETELDVPNDDGSLRPGMTATADISVDSRKNVLLVPNTALRFDPDRAASAAAGPAAGPQRTFVQSLTPGPGRRGFSQSPPPGAAAPPRDHPQVWTLRDGKPVAVPVKLGISDGRHTEIMGDGIAEGLAVIVSARYPSQP